MLKIVADDIGCEVTFAPVPLWEGVQPRPCVRYAHPFAFAAKTGEPIRQTSDATIIDHVINAYQSDKYGFMTPPPGAGTWADSLGDASVMSVRKAIGTGRPRRILEIGAGSGYVADALTSRYQPDEYVIVDPTIRGTVERAEVIREYFPCERLGSRRFDLILAFNCLEHVPAPVDFLRAISSRLTDGGLVVLVFPDCERQLRSGDLNVLIHEHLTYFTAASARYVVREAGFTVVSVESLNDTFSFVLSKGRQSPAELPRIDERDLLAESAHAFRTVVADTLAAVRPQLEAGHRVGFHGATNGLNIFMHLTGLGSHPAVRLYDGDAGKHGKFLPACLARIADPWESSYGDNAIVMVSAMSYFEPIARFARETHRVDLSRLLPLALGPRASR